MKSAVKILSCNFLIFSAIFFQFCHPTANPTGYFVDPDYECKDGGGLCQFMFSDRLGTVQFEDAWKFKNTINKHFIHEPHERLLELDLLTVKERRLTEQNPLKKYNSQKTQFYQTAGTDGFVVSFHGDSKFRQDLAERAGNLGHVKDLDEFVKELNGQFIKSYGGREDPRTMPVLDAQTGKIWEVTFGGTSVVKKPMQGHAKIFPEPEQIDAERDPEFQKTWMGEKPPRMTRQQLAEWFGNYHRRMYGKYPVPSYVSESLQGFVQTPDRKYLHPMEHTNAKEIETIRNMKPRTRQEYFDGLADNGVLQKTNINDFYGKETDEYNAAMDRYKFRQQQRLGSSSLNLPKSTAVHEAPETVEKSLAELQTKLSKNSAIIQQYHPKQVQQQRDKVFSPLEARTQHSSGSSASSGYSSSSPRKLSPPEAFSSNNNGFGHSSFAYSSPLSSTGGSLAQRPQYQPIQQFSSSSSTNYQPMTREIKINMLPPSSTPTVSPAQNNGWRQQPLASSSLGASIFSEPRTRNVPIKIESSSPYTTATALPSRSRLDNFRENNGGSIATHEAEAHLQGLRAPLRSKSGAVPVHNHHNPSFASSINNREMHQPSQARNGLFNAPPTPTQYAARVHNTAGFGAATRSNNGFGIPSAFNKYPSRY